MVARVLHISRGASADDYALLLQTEHWLEACDSKHRYGSNIKPYFKFWLNSDTDQSFFKWLDEGDGKLVDLPDRCASALFRKPQENFEFLLSKSTSIYQKNSASAGVRTTCW